MRQVAEAGASQETSSEAGAANGRVPGAEHILDFTDSSGSKYRIVSHDMSSEEMEQARDKVLEIVEGMIDDDSDVE